MKKLFLTYFGATALLFGQGGPIDPADLIFSPINGPAIRAITAAGATAC